MNAYRHTTEVHGPSNFRMNFLQGLIFLLVFVLLARLFYIQVVAHEYYFNTGLQQRAVIEDIRPERGNIYSLTSAFEEELYPLAVNEVYYEISVNPSKITRPQNITDIFVKHLNLEEEEVLSKVKQDNKKYESISKNAPRIATDLIKADLDVLIDDINKERVDSDQITTYSEMGVDFVKHVLRYYPDNDIGAHLLGFLGYGSDGYSREGKYGLEGYFEQELAGSIGTVIGEEDVTGKLFSGNFGEKVENGADIVLTIDHTVQFQACRDLAEAVVRYEAESGTVIVMETQTGAIRAMCNYPSFDPNKYNEVETPDVYNNLAVYHSYEPGSVMKAISMAIAIDQGKVTPNTTYTDEGSIKFASGQEIKNAGENEYGLVDMKEVLASSINTGVVFATSDINNKIYEDYMKKFGFGKKYEVQTSQEQIGNISSLSKPGDIFKATASYGQGITVTPLQMVSAVNVIANDGNLVRPYLVSEIIHEDGRVEKFGPEVIRQVISPSTAAQLQGMMIHVVDSGHAGKAAVDGYYVAGKTGTAQVADPKTGKYYTDRFIHNFVGFAPEDNPRFTIITKLDNPKAARYSADTAAPLFGEIADFLLEYYQIPPQR